MSVTEVLEHFKGTGNTAAALGITYQAVQQWIERGSVPEGRQWQIQALTGGDLKAGPKSTAA